MRLRPVKTLATTLGGIAAAIRAHPKVFGVVGVGVFAMNLFLPVAVLSLARGRFTHVTLNPWLSRLPEWLSSIDVSLARKLEFLSDLALAWVIANNPMGEVEWGFILDVPSLARFVFTSLLFGAYFALWSYRRDQLRESGWGVRTARYGGAGGALTSVLGFSTSACSVMGCGVPVLPVVGLALTGVSSGTLAFFGGLARVGTAVVLVVMTLGVAWLGWLVGSFRRGSEPPRVSPRVAALACLLALLPPSAAWAQGEVSLDWYGHALVRLTSPQGVRVAMEPFGEIGYPMPRVEADIVTVSHEHGG
jgi:hypothetical protein